MTSLSSKHDCLMTRVVMKHLFLVYWFPDCLPDTRALHHVEMEITVVVRTNTTFCLKLHRIKTQATSWYHYQSVVIFWGVGKRLDRLWPVHIAHALKIWVFLMSYHLMCCYYRNAYILRWGCQRLSVRVTCHLFSFEVMISKWQISACLREPQPCFIICTLMTLLSYFIFINLS